MKERFEVNLAFVEGDEVYLKVDKDGEKGMITGFIYENNAITYLVRWGDFTRGERLEIELTKEKPIF